MVVFNRIEIIKKNRSKKNNSLTISTQSGAGFVPKGLPHISYCIMA